MQRQVVLKNCGIIDPENINSYLENDGFKALEKSKKQMTPEKIIEEVTTSGLLGRGGAGFSCGLKWKYAREKPSDEKFVICNADEGEVGTFKDRYILQHDPFTLIEAIAIAAFAISAPKAYIYLRAEYHFLLDLLSNAISQVKEKRLMEGLEIEIREGAGSYMCGEESGLMNSIEGLRGEARYKPPFPADKGLWGKPTIINNVETLMNIPPIILNGSQWFKKMGTKKSKGTKVFSVSGDVKTPGIYELEMGSKLTELVHELAGAQNIKMIQIGGASGRIIPREEMNIQLCYEKILGSGAVTVFDESRDVIDVMLRNMEFLADESCGKCTPCREGTEAMMEILERLAQGEGVREDIAAMEELSEVMISSALCGLGQTAPLPILDSLNYFRKDYDARIEQSLLIRGLGGQL